MARFIEGHESELILAPENRAATFDDAATKWLTHVEHTKRIKPSTLGEYRIMLADPQIPASHEAGASKGRARI